MEKIKIIFVDFDWTLFDHNTRSFNESGIKALNLAKSKGIKLVINSARSFYSLNGLNTFQLIDFQGYVVSNGGLAIINNKLLYNYFFNQKIVNELMNEFNKDNVSFTLICRFNSYIKENNITNIKEFYDVFYEPYPINFNQYNNEEVLAIQVLIDESYDNKLKAICSKYNLFFNRFSSINVELTKKEFHKSEGIEEILKYLKIDKSEAMAFGDDTNDIPMFNIVKYGICMGNGNQEAKKHAFYITSNIEEDGIKNALEHFNVI